MRPDATAERYPALDGVRGLAVLLVVVFHFFMWFSPLGVEPCEFPLEATRIGLTGVDLFFVLSGFLITRILLAAKGEPEYLRNFFARRALRIFPLYYAILLAVWLERTIYGGAADFWAVNWTLWVYVQNVLPSFGWQQPDRIVGHYWTLAVEEHFYLVWPFVVRWASPRRLASVCVGLCAVAIGVRLSAVWWTSLNYYEFTPARMDALAVGALAAIASRSPGLLGRLRPILPWLTAAVGAFAVAMFFRCDRQPPDLGTAIEYTVRAVAYALLILSAFAVPTGRLAAALSFPALRRLGTISYGLYLFHPFVFEWCLWNVPIPFDLDDMAANRLVLFPVAVGLPVALASASFVCFERPILRLKRRFEYRGTASAPWEESGARSRAAWRGPGTPAE